MGICHRLSRLVTHLLERIARGVEPLTAIRLQGIILHGHHVVELIGELDPLSAGLRDDLVRAAGGLVSKEEEDEGLPVPRQSNERLEVTNDDEKLKV